MVWNSNLRHFLGRSARSRELDDARLSWENAQAAWRASPIYSADAEDPPGALALQLAKESWDRARGSPTRAVAVAIHKAIAELLTAEDIDDFNPQWDSINADVAIMVDFRDAVRRRQRWATSFDRCHRIFKRQLFGALDFFLNALPESCFGPYAEAEGSFDVPLIELLDEPAKLIRAFVECAFHPEVRDLGLFKELRRALTRNLNLATGFPPDQETYQPGETFRMPEEQKGKTPEELADIYLGGTPFRDLLTLLVPFNLSEEARFEHGHVVGGTGHGKTQLLQRLIHADLVRARSEKRSVVVIDSQGDLINRLVRLDMFAPGTTGGLADRLVLIDPADIEFPPSLNLFDAHLDRLTGYPPVDRERVLNGVIESYERFFGDLLGAELTQKQGVVFKYLARLMVTIPGATIHTLIQLMADPKPFREAMGRLDGSARFFFETEFFEPSFAQTKRQIQRRLWGVLSTPAFERMFAQERNKLDLFEALQEGKIVLVSTAKDLLKQEGSQLLGRFFIGLLNQAILERSALHPEDRTPTMVYVDEAQEYFDDSIETILNQARKYRTGITLAHQALDQLQPRLRAVIHSNTSLKCAGGVSARDARALAEELHTTAEFIEGMKRRSSHTEFAVWIRNETPRAIRLGVPLGFLERQPILDEEGYQALLERNRVRFCGTIAEVEASLSRMRGGGTFRPQVAEPSPEPASDQSTPPPVSVQPSDDIDHQAPGPRRAREASRPRPEVQPGTPQTGKGGAQHRYLQHLIKRLAEERGFRAVIEEAVEGGHVDVGLHHGEQSIACEVSVTSTPSYEAQNLAKCLRAGFVRIWAIAPDAKRSRAIRHQANSLLSSEQIARIEFLTTEELVEGCCQTKFIAG